MSRAAIALLLLACPAPSRADARVAIVAPDGALASAIGEALGPWAVEVVLVEGDSPGATMPQSVDEGRRVARAHRAAAVVWLSESETGWALWVYDADGDRAMARALPTGPPFDEPTAAAIALSVMAMLRHGAAAPPAERVRAPDSPAAARAPRLELSLGADAYATAPDQVEPRACLAVAWWPEAAEGIVGIALTLRFGTGIALEGAGLDARLLDARLGLRGHVRATIDRALVLGGLLGLGVRLVALDGQHASGRRVGASRVIGVAEVAAEVGVDLDPVALVARLGAAISPWSQRYEVAGVPVLESNAIWPFAEAAVEISLR